MQPTPSAVHYNAPMTGFSVAIVQNTSVFVAHRIFPVLPVSKQSDIFYKYPAGAFLRSAMKRRAPGAAFARAGYEVEKAGPYYCEQWGLEDQITDEQRANQDTALNADQDSTTFLTHQGLLRREIGWCDTYFKTGVWGFNRTGVVGAPTSGQFRQWNDGASDPIGDVKSAKTEMQARTGFRPNVLVISQQVWDVLSEHPDLIDRVKHSGGVGNGNPAKLTLQAVAGLLEVDRIEVLGAIQNTAAEGLADVTGFIAGKHAALFYIPPSVGLRTPVPGLTFTWNGLLGNDPMGIAISGYREDTTNSDINRIQMAYDQHVVATELGYFFSSAVA